MIRSPRSVEGTAKKSPVKPNHSATATMIRPKTHAYVRRNHLKVDTKPAVTARRPSASPLAATIGGNKANGSSTNATKANCQTTMPARTPTAPHVINSVGRRSRVAPATSVAESAVMVTKPSAYVNARSAPAASPESAVLRKMKTAASVGSAHTTVIRR